ncbi:MAG: hypothetical protein LIQ31_07645 [Planctomycetes bacterium]|nr:hypothetical protein [Planctomycetota bacterium]
MDFIVLDESLDSGTLATVYSEANFAGEEQSWRLGLYSRSQLIFDDIGSVKLNPFVTFILYENTDRSGAFAFLTEDEADLRAKLNFRPNLFAVIQHASIFKAGELRGNLVPGEYKADVLQDVDTLRIPESVRVMFWRDEAGKSAPDHQLGSGEYTVDATLKQYARIVVSLVSGGDLLADEVLSDEEMTMVAGGGCSVRSCGAQACGADLGVVQGCAAQACGVNLIPGLPIGL